VFAGNAASSADARVVAAALERRDKRVIYLQLEAEGERLSVSEALQKLPARLRSAPPSRVQSMPCHCIPLTPSPRMQGVCCLQIPWMMECPVP